MSNFYVRPRLMGIVDYSPVEGEKENRRIWLNGKYNRIRPTRNV